MSNRTLVIFAAALAVWGFRPVPLPAAKSVDRIQKPVAEAIDIRQDSQQKNEKWRQENEELTARLEQLQQIQTQLEAQRTGFKTQLTGAEQRLAQKEKERADIAEIEARMMPFLDSLVADIARRIDNGPPFLLAERRQRVGRLKIVLADPQVAVSEKYRKAMEALQVEAEYGFTIEVYQETVDVNGEPTLVDIFRLGRLNLFYLSRDKRHSGVYDVAQKNWRPLDETHRPAIEAAIDIAAKRRTADLLWIPLGRIAAP